VVETDFGTIKFELSPEDAPKTVDNFAALARKEFYNGLSFHRVVKGVLTQLDGQYTVFGRVVEGMDVVRKIAQAETDSDDRPLEPISMQDVRIEGP